MRIIVLDGKNKNPGDLSWAELQALGDVTIYPTSTAEEAAERVVDTEILLVNKVKVDGALMDKAPGLKLIVETATGYDNIDLAAAAERGIVVSNVPSYATQSVAQHTMALLLEINNRVGLHAASVAKGDWCRSSEFCYFLTPLHQLAGKTMLVVGYGRIGRATARLAEAFGMRVIWVDSYQEGSLSLEEALPQADVVSLHCNMKPGNKAMINAETIALMKDGVILLNTARGALLDEQAVADALKSGKIAYAGVDVLSKEPPVATNPLLSAPNCIITPHISGCSVEARANLLAVCCENVRAFLAGSPVNVVQAK